MQEIQETQDQFLGQEDLEEDVETHSSILAGRITWTEEPGGLESMGPQRVRHNWVTEHTTHTQTTYIAFLKQQPMIEPAG